MTLPWVTLIPDFYGPFPLQDVVLDRVAFDQLMTRVRQGDGVQAYIDIVQRCSWRGGESALHSVRVHDGSPSKTAQQGAAADDRPQAGDRGSASETLGSRGGRLGRPSESSGSQKPKDSGR